MTGILTLNGRRTCMNKCVFCPGQRWPNRVLTWSEAINDANTLISIGATEITIGGRDPGEWEKLPEIVEYLKNAGIQLIRIRTHGRTLKNLEFVQRLKDTGALITLDTPLYGSTEEIHNKITQSKSSSLGNAFQDTIQGIKNCVKVGLPISGYTGLTQGNKEDINNILNLYRALLSTGEEITIIDISSLVIKYPVKLLIQNWCLPTKDMGPYLREATHACDPKVILTIHEVPYCVYGSYTPLIYNENLCKPRKSIKGKKSSPAFIIANTPSDPSQQIPKFLKRAYFEECFNCNLRQQCMGLPVYELQLFGSSNLRAFRD